MRRLPASWLLLVAACAPDAPPPPAAAARPTPPPVALRFTVPEGWVQEMPSSSMRKAQYRVPDKEKQAKDAELALFHFRMPSSAEENLKRWADQMGAAPPKGEEIQGNHKITLGDITGTYAGDAGAAPVANARMLAAMVETSEGPWFFKLVGPADTVGDWREEFIALLKSARR
jgi:hypothetical protein